MRVLIAARLSRKPKNGEDEEYPIEAQDRWARDWAVQEGHEVVDTAADYKSGTVAPWDRPRLRPWVTRPEKIAQYDAIVAHKTDRISRGTDADFARIEAWAAEHKKKLIIVGPGGGIQFPARDDSDYWQWVSEKRQARKEWEGIRTRSMNRQADLKADGKLVGRPAWGYEVTGPRYGKTLVPTKQGRTYVPQVFKQIADGRSLAQVAAWLNAQGVLTQQGKPWSGATVRRQIIVKRTYAGTRQTRDGVTVLTVEPLVDARLWTRANNRLKAEKRGHRGPVTGKPALLSGVLFCARCRAPMYRVYGGGKYRCAGAYPDRRGCGNVIDLKATDLLATVLLSTAEDQWTEMRLVEGVNYDARLAEIDLELQDLPRRRLSRAEEQAERERLWAEQDELSRRESIPDHWEPTDTGKTVGQHWASLDFAGQREMLLEDVKIFARVLTQEEMEGIETTPPPPRTPTLRVESRLFKLPVELSAG